MRTASTLAVWTLLVTILLAGCGGGGGAASSTADTGRSLTGRIHANSIDSTQRWTVCLDSNLNLRCDSDETSTTSNDDGTYRLRLPSTDATGFLVAETTLMRAGAAAGDAGVTLRLAAPEGAIAISSLSTLVAAQMVGSTPLDALAAQHHVRSLLALPDSVALLAAPASAANRDSAGLFSVAYDALRSTTLARRERGVSETQSSALVAGNAAATDPAVVLAVMSHYANPAGAGLLPGVSVRTIQHEAVEAVRPTRCVADTPQRLRIDTDNAAPVLSKENYVSGRLRVDATAAGAAALDVQLQIRGRGNSTWGMPKKPYRLKLASATALLGMSADKDWALLANYADKTLLRNAVAFCLSQQLGLAYTPAYRFVELELNGEYQGVYQLVEHIKAAPQRVDIGSAAATSTDPGGFLAEIDARLDADRWFVTAQGGVPYALKSDATEAQATLIAGLFELFEARLFGTDFAAGGARSYLPMLDNEALVDFYLIQEYLRNNDAFWSSTFVSRKDSGPLVFGPVWDFDLAAGNIDYADNDAVAGWWVRGNAAFNGYIEHLFTDPAFERQVAARWQFLSRRLPALQRFISQSATTLDAAQRRNFALWDILGIYVWPNPVVTGSYAGEIDYLSSWLRQRAAWMDVALGAVGSTPGR